MKEHTMSIKTDYAKATKTTKNNKKPMAKKRTNHYLGDTVLMTAATVGTVALTAYTYGIVNK